MYATTLSWSSIVPALLIMLQRQQTTATLPAKYPLLLSILSIDGARSEWVAEYSMAMPQQSHLVAG
jgi:hypothetical protein